MRSEFIRPNDIKSSLFETEIYTSDTAKQTAYFRHCATYNRLKVQQIGAICVFSEGHIGLAVQFQHLLCNIAA